MAIKTSTKGGISASVNIIYLGTIDPYINLNKSQFEYEYNNIEFCFIGKGGSKIRELQAESGARINVRLNIKIRLKFV